MVISIALKKDAKDEGRGDKKTSGWMVLSTLESIKEERKHCQEGKQSANSRTHYAKI